MRNGLSYLILMVLSYKMDMRTGLRISHIAPMNYFFKLQIERMLQGDLNYPIN